jgi:hypothetical protein
MNIMEKKIKTIEFVDGMILTTTMDGQVYSRPIDAFPLLRNASDEQRRAYTIGKFGDDVRWEAIDEDIHVSSLTKSLASQSNLESHMAYA